MELLICMMLFIHSFILTAEEEDKDMLLAAFWNLENFFDWKDGGYSDSDRDFSASGDRCWTKSRYWRKCHGVAKTILWMKDRYGRLPDVAGFAEVENRGVLGCVTEGTLLRKYDYSQIHQDSPDRRGIDVALIYRTGIFDLVSFRSFPVTEDMEGESMATRDILHVCLERKGNDGKRYHFLVNHHPSKYGGTRESGKKRRAVMSRMIGICDSLIREGESNIICMGDFNDSPDGDAFSLAEPLLENTGMALHRKGKGTIRFSGKWELIDMFLVSRDVSDRVEMEICAPGFLLVRDSGHPGLKPFRTYTGPVYSGGISDHLPIILKICPG